MRQLSSSIVPIFFIGQLFVASEAHVSQVHSINKKIPLSESVELSTEILIVKDLDKTEVLEKIVLPKETHHQKSQETVFEELVAIYEVIEPLKSSETFKKGQLIKVFLDRAYGLDVIKTHHEQGILESPYEFNYDPHFKVTSNTLILFLTKNPKYNGVWSNSQHAQEGIKGKKLIQAEIRKQSSRQTK